VEKIIEYLIIAGAAIIITIIFVIAAARGWLKNVKVSKDGLDFHGVEKRVKLSNFNKLLDEKIIELDKEVEAFSVSTIHNLRRIFKTHLDPIVSHPGEKRAISGAARAPLYDASRKNNFKFVLMPENIKKYIDGIMEEIKEEYEDATFEHGQYICPIHGGKCVEYPPFEALEELLREKIIYRWAVPLRNFQIETHRKKISLYKKYINSYQELGDEVRVKITEQCIEKNEKYITGLSRRPEAHEL
jgi:hypothetical protein